MTQTQTTTDTRSRGNGSTKHVVEEAHGNGAPRGKITMSEDVVAMIAGIAAREIDGIHSIGKSRLINFGSGDDPTRGVAAEVGQKEAAVDLEVTIEHGCDMRKIAKQLRTKIAEQVDLMTGRKVVEVNIDVIGIEVPGLHEPDTSKQKPEPEPRVH